MPAPKTPGAPTPAAPKTDTPAPKADGGRKPWKKKSHVDVVLEQADKLRKEIAEEEAALNTKKQQLKKFEEAVKVFQS